MIYLVSFLKFCFWFFFPSDLLCCVTYTDLTYLVFLFASILFGDLTGGGGTFSCKVYSPIFWITCNINRAFLMGHPSEEFHAPPRPRKCSVFQNCELIIGYITLLCFQALWVFNFVLLKVLYSTEFIAVIFCF